jgi:hypothetical protein
MKQTVAAARLTYERLPAYCRLAINAAIKLTITEERSGPKSAKAWQIESEQMWVSAATLSGRSGRPWRWS